MNSDKKQTKKTKTVAENNAENNWPYAGKTTVR